MHGLLARIGSYNVHKCVGADYRYDVGRIVTVIRELECDVVGLQEVDNRAGRGHDSLQLDHLAEHAQMTAIPGMRIIRHLGEYGNALLTRHPVRRVRRHDLSYTAREPRGALDVELDIRQVSLRVIVTHFGLNARERNYQAQRLTEIIKDADEHLPVVVVGDINEWLPRARPLQLLHGILGASPAPASFPSMAPVFALDRIWVRPRALLRSVKVHRSAVARRASDHLPVVAELRPPAHALQP